MTYKTWNITDCLTVILSAGQFCICWKCLVLADLHKHILKRSLFNRNIGLSLSKLFINGAACAKELSGCCSIAHTLSQLCYVVLYETADGCFSILQEPTQSVPRTYCHMYHFICVWRYSFDFFVARLKHLFKVFSLSQLSSSPLCIPSAFCQHIIRFPANIDMPAKWRICGVIKFSCRTNLPD